MTRILLVLGLCITGCQPPGEGTYEGAYAQCLCAGDLGNLVSLVDEDSILTIRLSTTAGALGGELLLKGEVKILGHTIKDNGNDAYPIEELELTGEDLTGKVVIDKFPDAKFDGTFEDDRARLFVKVNFLGEILLDRLETPEEVEDTAEDTDP